MSSKQINEYLQSWSGRWRGALLDYYILYHGAFSTVPLYAYQIYQDLMDYWGESSISIQTIYSRINSLEKSEMVKIHRQIIGGRMQKIITTSENGFEVLDQITEILKKELNQTELTKLQELTNYG